MPSACSTTPTTLPRVTGAYLQPVIEAAAAQGVDARALAAGAGLDPHALEPLPSALPARDYIALLDAGALLCRDPHFGLHVGERVRLGTYSVYGGVLLACANFGQALEQTQRYEQLAHDLGRSQLTLDGALAHYTWISHFPQASRHLVESVFAGIRVFGSWLAGRPLAPRAVAFAHACAADPGEYERVLGTLPRFDAPAHVAALDAALLAMPVANADVGLYPVLQQHAERLLRERTPAAVPAGIGIVPQVRAAVLRNLAHDRVRLAGIAADLGMSARTLQRKLSEAGASFQQVLDEARHGLAMDYLRQDGLSLVDVAFLLGFREQSAFTHAFREWSGMNPGAWRERALAGSA